MTVVKICGLRTIEHAHVAIAAGAHLLGFVFAKSRRQVAPHDAATIIAAVRAIPSSHPVACVGVFVNHSSDDINAIAAECQLDYLQLSGDESPDILPHLSRPAIKALRLRNTPDEQAWIDGADRALMAPCPWLIDAHTPGAYGGTGQCADWHAARQFAHHHPIILAGGLTPETVQTAITTVRPWGVDVSSGVETNGTKDAQRIQQFLTAVLSLGPSQVNLSNIRSVV